MHRNVLVTGATGNVGRHVTLQLRRTEGVRVRALTRRPEAVRLPAGVEVARGDLMAPDTLEAGLRDVDAVFLLWPLLTSEGAPAVLEVLARHARRVVYLSAPGGSFHAELEQLIEGSGLEWTFLRPTGFATNTLAWAPQIRSEGIVRWPYGEARRSLIHEQDIAAVAVRALMEENHVGQRYLLTGPEALTQIEQAHAIGRAIGRPVQYQELSPDTARRELLTAWGNAAFVDAALAGWSQMVAHPEPVTHTVEEITGAPARPFRDWARDHAEDFR